MAFSEIALQHVSLALRGEVGWEVVTPLSEIGWRIRKHYYQLKSKGAPHTEFWGSWTDFGPDKYLDDKDMHSLFKSLAQIQHPYIHPIEMSLCTDLGGLVVRLSQRDGSLRDILCNSKPKQSFLKKYGNPKGHKPLDANLIALYGKHILEALKFLHDKGIPYGHLHTGNVIIENNRARLLDIENGVLGVPSFYRPYFMQHRKISSLEAIDVYCFGHTLYEMTFGAPLHESIVENFPDCSPSIKPILQSILSFDACKSGLPTIDGLLNHPFFSAVSTAPSFEKTFFKIPTSTKEKLKIVRNQIEERLKEEQKMVRSQKRLVKVQEKMSSEEEKKKQRHKQRHEQKLLVKEQQKRQEKLRQQSLEGEKADSVNSSTATSIGTATPPSRTSSHVPSPPPPPPPPPPLNLPNGQTVSLEKPSTLPKQGRDERSALLGAICNFNKSSLRNTHMKN